jgi:alkanesulfonate monooxygenase SsuD/methylene tetrahydromethanopterin reductase-like flavin-dependent oxidoreductase (luciferase family)
MAVGAMRYSVSGTMARTWEEVRRAAVQADECGFDGFYASDHLTGVAGFAEEQGVLDALTLLAALAPLTTRLRLGAAVSPITFRQPPMLARAIGGLDVISGARAVLGVGAGWSGAEHSTFGIPFPSTRQRLELLEDACRMLKALWEAVEPVDLEGQFPLRRAALSPRPIQRAVPLLVAGASDRSIAIAPRWAAMWHCVGSPAFLAERTERLRQEEAKAGRPEGSVEVVARVTFEVVPDVTAARERREAVRRSALKSGEAQRRSWVEGEDPGAATYVGPLEGLRDRVDAYEKAGVQEVYFPLYHRPDAVREIGGILFG